MSMGAIKLKSSVMWRGRNYTVNYDIEVVLGVPTLAQLPLLPQNASPLEHEAYGVAKMLFNDGLGEAQDTLEELIRKMRERRQNQPLTTTDTQIYEGPIPYRKPEGLLNLLLDFLDKNPDCETAFNAEIAAVAAFTKREAVPGGIRGSIGRFRKNPFSLLDTYPGTPGLTFTHKFFDLANC
jgi:hypothetical protein